MNVLNIILEHIVLYILLLIVIVVNVVCILYLVIKDRRQDKKEIEDLVEDINKRKPKEEVVKEDVSMDTGKLEIEKVLEKMQKDLEATPEEVISTFEQDQEDKSIISYQELLNTMKRKEPAKPIEIKEEPVVDVIDIDENKDLEVHQVEKVPEFKEEIKEKIEGKKEENYKKKEFKNTEIISPIFGKITEVEEEYPKVPLMDKEEELEEILEELPRRSDRYEGTLDVGPLAEEMRKNDEFLRSLKEFRNNL